MKATLNDLLNAKGVSEPLREAVKALINRLEAAEKAWKISDQTVYDLTEKVIPNIQERLEAAEKERDALRAALQHEADCVEAAKAEIEALRSKTEKMEKTWLSPDGYHILMQEREDILFQAEKMKQRAPCKDISMWPTHHTQPTQLAPSVLEGWLRAIDEALVVTHLGVANVSDTYEQAKAKLDNLIGFHVDVATDPAVNGGWKLMPVEPTEEVYQCFSAYDGTSYSNPFDRDEFVKDWREALAKATEAKS